MAETEKKDPFHYTFLILKYCYAIPKSMEEPYITRFTIIYVLIKLLSWIVFFLLPAAHLITTLKEFLDDTGADISEDLSTMLGSVSTLATSTAFWILYRDWLAFFEDLEDCKKFAISAEFEKLRNRLKAFSIFLATYAVSGVVLYAVVSAKETSYCKAFNEKHGLNEICGLFMPAVLPFGMDGNRNFVRVPLFILQMSFVGNTCTAALVITSIPYQCVEILSVHMGSLRSCFRNVFEVTSDEQRRNRLKFCIRFHNNILSLSQRLSTLGKYTCGNLCITCALVFGCMENLILKSKPLGGTIFFVGYIVALFLVCHGGQKLIDETLSIGEAIYDSRWCEGNVEIMKDVKFILARCQRPITMNALPLGVANYALFLMIMKASFSYFTLLTQNT